MLNILDWLITSSKNPDKISLTVKSATPFILGVAAFFKLDLVQGDLDQLVESIIAIISGGFFIYGFARKIILTIRK